MSRCIAIELNNSFLVTFDQDLAKFFGILFWIEKEQKMVIEDFSIFSYNSSSIDITFVRLVSHPVRRLVESNIYWVVQ